MKFNPEQFNIKYGKFLPVDEFFEKILYEPKKGYYAKKIPFGRKGDFVTAPTISNIFSEIITVWIVSAWEKLGKPNKFNLVELGPGEGSLSKVIIETLKKFPNINNSIKIYLYEKSNFLKKIQQKKLKNSNVEWVRDFNEIKGGPVIFFGNEFFDAIPIKQFLYKKKEFFEKNYFIDTNSMVKETFIKAKKNDVKLIKKFEALKGLNFIEFPKLGFDEMDKIIKKIKKLTGGILLIDYGYLKIINKSTLQSVMKNKKLDVKHMFDYLGEADITSLVNFKLLKEYFYKKNLKVKNIVTQKFFLEKMGIIERAKILEKKMSNKQKDYMSITLKRLLDRDLMGELFKVIFAFKSKKTNYLGFN